MVLAIALAAQHIYLYDIEIFWWNMFTYLIGIIRIIWFKNSFAGNWITKDIFEIFKESTGPSYWDIHVKLYWDLWVNHIEIFMLNNIGTYGSIILGPSDQIILTPSDRIILGPTGRPHWDLQVNHNGTFRSNHIETFRVKLYWHTGNSGQIPDLIVTE